jgi:hypothetical protein
MVATHFETGWAWRPLGGLLSAARDLRPLARIDEALQDRFLVDFACCPADEFEETSAKHGVNEDRIGRGAGRVPQGDECRHDEVVINRRPHG